MKFIHLDCPIETIKFEILWYINKPHVAYATAHEHAFLKAGSNFDYFWPDVEYIYKGNNGRIRINRENRVFALC